jgi:Nucleotidyl transferase AbiEii toxin, Type IV TA system
MFPPDIFRHTLTRLVAILRQNGVRFHLTGGIASVAYGEPRMTQDIDVVVDNVPLSRAADAFMAAVSEAGFLLDLKQVRRAIAEKSMFQIFDMTEALKVDIYPRELVPGELDRSTVIEVLEGMPLPVASRADAATSKLVWASKGSHKSRRDLRQIVRQMSSIDRAELDRLARLLRLESLLVEILAEQDEIAG